MTDVLRRVAKAARQKDRATHEYIRAIQTAARKHSYAEVARAAGTTRQNVRQLILKKEVQ